MGVMKNLATDRMLGGRGLRKSGQVFVTGDKELDKELRDLPLAMQKKALRPALRVCAKIIQKAAKQYAPKLTGKTRVSIKVRSIKRSRVRIGIGIAAGAEYEGGGTLPHYAKWVEFGTDIRTTKSGANRGRITPRPFLRRAMNEKKREVIQTFRTMTYLFVMRLKFKGSVK